MLGMACIEGRKICSKAGGGNLSEVYMDNMEEIKDSWVESFKKI